jgi:hypothetical protein
MTRLKIVRKGQNMQFSANETINPTILTKLLNKEVPNEWASNNTFVNHCDMTEEWQVALINCLTKTLAERRPGADKKEDKDFYAFSMEPKFPLSKSLQESGWRQYNCTIRLGQLEGQKAKRTHYTFHFWAQPSPSGIDYSQIILLKLKLEGKFIPSTKQEQEMIVELTNQY